MLRPKTGWVAQRADEGSWCIDGVEASGIYISYGHTKAFLHYSGSADENAQISLAIPCDSHLLRELAEAFTELADFKDLPIHVQMKGLHKS